MTTESPFPQASTLLEAFLSRLPVPPLWLQDEAANRVILVLNHVLMGEQEAMRRLARQSGRYVTFVWRTQEFVLGITPVGLFERGSSGSPSDLCLVVQSADVLVLAADWVNGRKPEVHIDGDVQLAADVNWLADHVQWDIEEDLAKVMGDVPAHMLVTLAHSVSGVLKRFVSATPSTGGASA